MQIPAPLCYLQFNTVHVSAANSFAHLFDPFCKMQPISEYNGSSYFSASTMLQDVLYISQKCFGK